jgi:tripartite-type tricarboxylate transporter receptor subunit TctC
MKRRSLLLAGLAGAGTAFAQNPRPGLPARAASTSLPVPAQHTYPTRPVTLVVPFPPGGPTDGSARIFAKSLSQQLGQTFTIENRAGAGGTVGTESVAHAAADGYTLLWAGTSGTVVAPALAANLNRQLPYDPMRSFDPISMAVRSPMMLVGNLHTPGGNLNDLLAASKGRQLTVATAGHGSVGHLSLEYMREFIPLNTKHVPFKGGVPGLEALMAGKVDLFFDSVQFLYPSVRDGKVKPYVTTGSARSTVLPSVPTVGEVVHQPFEAYSWFGLVAPAGTPPSILRVLNEAMVKAATDEEVVAFEKNLALESAVGTDMKFGVTIFADYRKWAGVSARANIRPEG